jgi:hypothetical protein
LKPSLLANWTVRRAGAGLAERPDPHDRALHAGRPHRPDGPGQKISNALGQPIIFEDKPGANAIIGTNVVAKAAPDGYTFGTVIAERDDVRFKNGGHGAKNAFATLRPCSPASKEGHNP